jgi:alkylation response protein AidB-like acyl-CoA dehydrogenase
MLTATMGLFCKIRNRLVHRAVRIVMIRFCCAMERVQFDKPIAATQLQQKKLAEMLTENNKSTTISFKLRSFTKRR